MFTVSLFWHYLQNNIVQIQFLKWLDLLQINRIFISISSVLWPYNMLKMRWRRGRRGSGRQRWGSSRRSLRPPSRLGRGTPFPQTNSLGAFGASILALVFPPEPYHFLKPSGANDWRLSDLNKSEQLRLKMSVARAQCLLKNQKGDISFAAHRQNDIISPPGYAGNGRKFCRRYFLFRSTLWQSRPYKARLKCSSVRP